MTIRTQLKVAKWLAIIGIALASLSLTLFLIDALIAASIPEGICFWLLVVGLAAIGGIIATIWGVSQEYKG